MKKLLSLALAGSLLLLAGGCGAGEKLESSGAASNLAPAADVRGGMTGGAYYSMAGPMEDMAEAPIPEWNTEEYDSFQENGFRSVNVSPLSTFAADVDTASYANLRARLLAGEEVTPDMVRIEEMLNYFHYDDPQSVEGEPFGVSAEIVPCPWNGETKLLRLGLQALQPDWEAMPASNLVFLIDVSGSMGEWNKLPLVKQAFGLLTEHLRPEDVISIVVYASENRVVLDGGSGSEPEVIRSAIEELTANGATNGGQGIQMAYALAEKHFIPGGNNRVILASDGDLNVGVTGEGELTRLVEEKKESGVFLSVLGFGMGNLKDNKLEALADHGNGNYAYIDSALEAKRVLAEEMGGTLFTVAKDVKLQVEFNPEWIKGYRLIGYENRTMAAEDFADDGKDGGEIGAGHHLTVLYELVEADSELELPGGELKYQSAQTTGSEEWLTLQIRYKAPEGEESALLSCPVGPEALRETPSEDTAFAACVAQVGMLLRDSDYAGSADYGSVAEQMEALESLKGDPYKEEFLYLVKQLARRG